MFVFGYTQGFADVENDTTISGLSCIAEVLGILFLGVMDFVDICTLAAKLDDAESSTNDHMQNKDANTEALFYVATPSQGSGLF